MHTHRKTAHKHECGKIHTWTHTYTNAANCQDQSAGVTPYVAVLAANIHLKDYKPVRSYKRSQEIPALRKDTCSH